MRIVDLSYDFFPGMDPDEKRVGRNIEFAVVQSVEQTGTNVMRICMGNHSGTHIDGPRHIIPGAETLDQLPLQVFYGTAVIADLPRGHDQAVTRKDLQSVMPEIQRDDIVLIRTGWDTRCPSADYRDHHAYLSADGAEFLVEKKVRMVGIDARSVDLPHALVKEGLRYISLRILLQNRIPVIHNLRNLQPVAGRRVTVAAWPIALRGVDSAPARVVALVED